VFSLTDNIKNKKQMTLEELKQKIDHYYEMSDRYHDLEVCIPNNKNGYGGTSVTMIKNAHRGVDWDSGKFFIIPETPMIEKPLD
jgi:hypothetical protein